LLCRANRKKDNLGRHGNLLWAYKQTLPIKL
jgi:hypothetical protein